MLVKKFSPSIIYSIILFFCGILILLISLYFQKILSPSFVINEVSFENNDKQDWIEIYNPGLSTRSLKGLYISDDKAEFTKFQITEDIIIAPKGFVVLYGKDYDITDAEKQSSSQIIQINFGIKNGEMIYLVSENGVEMIDSFSAITPESLESTMEKTIGRFPDGRDEVFLFSTSSQGEENIKDDMSQIIPQR